MSIEEYEKLSEERPDLLRIIDGVIYYSFDYTDYLYNELQKRDNIINELEKDMNNYYEEYKDVDDIVISENARVIKIYLDKLKELKEK